MDARSYRIPTELTATQTKLRRVLIVGACFLDHWTAVIQSVQPDCTFERVLFNHTATLPATLQRPWEDYDFQVIAIPFRSVLPESSYMRLLQDQPEDHARLFEEAVQRLEMLVGIVTRYSRDHQVPAFVVNFFVPSQNPVGRMLDRYDLRNPVYFVERLNEELDKRIRGLQGVHGIDVDQIAATFGRRYIQDDVVSAISHNSLIGDWMRDVDMARIEPPRKGIGELYGSLNADFIRVAWSEVVASYRTLRQIDTVKMVVVDLDDTLWRGIIAEREDFDPSTQVEGWPLGVAEALIFLKRRGVMLAIVSKNDENTIRNIWPAPFGGRLELSDFAFVKINWEPKAGNVAAIVKAANILPSSVVFVDDNPVERAAVKAALPGIRAIGSDPYQVRRILLWSAETQVAVVTDESSRRTEMMQQQQLREATRQTLSRDEFLQSLSVKIEMIRVPSAQSPYYHRVLELINKTNQFNTTGKRWTSEELTRALDEVHVHCFKVKDRFTQYGVVGVLIVRGAVIEQFVMSCRVLGMDVEVAVIDEVVGSIRQRQGPMTPVAAVLTETPVNFPCRDVYRRAGFVPHDDMWIRPAAIQREPVAHIDLITA